MTDSHEDKGNVAVAAKPHQNIVTAQGQDQLLSDFRTAIEQHKGLSRETLGSARISGATPAAVSSSLSQPPAITQTIEQNAQAAHAPSPDKAGLAAPSELAEAFPPPSSDVIIKVLQEQLSEMHEQLAEKDFIIEEQKAAITGFERLVRRSEKPLLIEEAKEKPKSQVASNGLEQRGAVAQLRNMTREL